MTGTTSATTASGFAGGDDAPEKRELRVGFIPLTDCASIVVAAEHRFDEKYGIRIIPSRESSWAAIRDKLIYGELDAAHCLYGLVYGIQTGVGGPRKDMSILMGLNQNGQAITLSNRLREQGVIDGASLAGVVLGAQRKPVFAQTFPTGTHAMWLYYWLAAVGIDPSRDIKSITVPPPLMAANMCAGNMVGFCAGEPWNNQAIIDGAGFTVATSQEIWPDHPEKVLGTTEAWVERHPNAARALTAALLDASRWIDASEHNKRLTAELIARPQYIDTPADVIVARMLGKYDDGFGRKWQDAHALKFFDDGAVNFPYLSDGMWFMVQHRRWGMLKHDVDYLAIARRVHRLDIYCDAASAIGVSLPRDVMRVSRLIDGAVWDGNAPEHYAATSSVLA